MIETEIHFVENKHFLSLSSIHGRHFVIHFTVVNFDACEERIFVSNVDTAHIEAQSMGFVRFQRRRDGQLCISVTIDDVDEFLLLNCADHESSALWISREELSWNNSTATSLSEGLLVLLIEYVFFSVVLQNDHTPTVRANNYIVSIGL